MASIQLGWYSPVSFRPMVEDGRVVALACRVFLCNQCAVELGALVQGDDGVWRTVDKGQVSNIRWSSKGYDGGLDCECLCGKHIEDGEEIWLTIDAA